MGGRAVACGLPIRTGRSPSPQGGGGAASTFEATVTTGLATAEATPRPLSAGYIGAIDGLRAIAVLSVMICHLDRSWLPGGFTGVDVFFTISGFVVTLSMMDQRFARVPDVVALFYARRLRRIAPALIVMLLVATLATVLFVPDAWLSEAIPSTGVAAFSGVSNVVLAAQTNTYFAPRAEYNTFLHTWSLGVEEQFYVHLSGADRARHRRPVSTLARARRRHPGGVVGRVARLLRLAHPARAGVGILPFAGAVLGTRRRDDPRPDDGALAPRDGAMARCRARRPRCARARWSRDHFRARDRDRVSVPLGCAAGRRDADPDHLGKRRRDGRFGRSARGSSCRIRRPHLLLALPLALAGLRADPLDLRPRRHRNVHRRHRADLRPRHAVLPLRRAALPPLDATAALAAHRRGRARCRRTRRQRRSRQGRLRAVIRYVALADAQYANLELPTAHRRQSAPAARMSPRIGRAPSRS